MSKTPEQVAMGHDEEAKFWRFVVADPGSGCWLWGGTRTTNGYGHFWYGGRHRTAHRVLWQHERGAVPKGLELDHLCRNRSCVNPAHLESVTHKENSLRGVGPTAKNAKTTHCANGHEFTDQNTATYRNGWRSCRACHNAKCRAYRAAKKGKS